MSWGEKREWSVESRDVRFSHALEATHGYLDFALFRRF